VVRFTFRPFSTVTYPVDTSLLVDRSVFLEVMIMGNEAICATGVDSKTSDVDGLPYSTLLYGNGPGFSQPRPVPSNSSSSEMAGRNSVHGAAVPRQWATHGGEDVPIYAQVR
jgi:alkaline phosphatase